MAQRQKVTILTTLCSKVDWLWSQGGECDRCTPAVLTNWNLVQADAQQVGLIKINPIVWGYQWEHSTKPKKTFWLEAGLTSIWNCINLTTDQPLYIIKICNHQGPWSSPSRAPGYIAVVSSRVGTLLKVTPWDGQIPYLKPDNDGLVTLSACM